MPSTSRSRSGCRLDDVEHLLAEGAHELLGVDRADAPDHAGGKVLLDAFDRRRRRGAQEARLELLAVGAVVDPFARRGDPLAGRNGGGMADHGHQVAMPARLDPQNAKAVLGIVVGDALDETRQNFLRLILGRVFHGRPGRIANCTHAIGAQFGIEFRLDGEPHDDSVTLYLTVIFPPQGIHNPHTGTTMYAAKIPILIFGKSAMASMKRGKSCPACRPSRFGIRTIMLAERAFTVGKVE